MNKDKNKLIPELRFPEFENDGEWGVKEVGEIFEVTRGYVLAMTLVKDTPSDKYSYPVFSSQTKNNGLAGYYNEYLYKDAITWTTDGANAGDVNYRIGKFYCTNVCGVLINKKGFANLCVAELINSVSKSYVSYVGNPKLMNGVMSKIEIPIPSIQEQQKIASCLSSLDEVILFQSQKLDALKKHKKGLMQNLFPQEGETVPKYRFPEFEKDGDWISTKLNAIANISSGGTPSRAKKEYWNGNIPWVSTTLIDFNEIKKANEFITLLGLENSSTKIFPKGTILMAMYGQGKTRGKVAVLDLDAAINQACAAIKLKTGMNINFLFQNLASRYDEIRSISNQGGQDNLSGELVKNIPICYPNEKSGEQQKIASCLSSLDDLITAQAEKIEQLQLHKKGLMQGLFPKLNTN